MQVRVLGCSGGIGKDLSTTSFLINEDLLLDAGTGVGDLSLEQMLSIRYALVTHAHLDHVCGIALMLASIYDDMPPTITLYAPPPVLMVLKISLFNWQLWPDFTELPSEEEPLLQLHALDDQKINTLANNLSVKPVILSHSVESFAYIINDGQTTLCFCGDTGPTEKLWQEINNMGGVDHIIIEASYPNENELLALQSGHYTAKLLAQDLHQLEKKPKVHIHHMKPGCEEIVMQQCKQALSDFDLNIVVKGQVLTLN